MLTNHGSLSVSFYGDPEKPALVTYPDVALNRKLGDIQNEHFVVCFYLEKLDIMRFQHIYLKVLIAVALNLFFCIF